jgi:nucleotide-binding universal stress UspA family protein
MAYLEDFKYLKIMVPTSGPVPAEQNARYIMRMARNLRAELLVVHVRDKGEDREGDLALDIFDKVSKDLDVKVTLKPAIGEISRTIISIAKFEEVDLIVMGATKGRNVAQWIIDKIKTETDIPIVVIPWKYDEGLHKEVISG